MFQYATERKTIEDTELITKKDAVELYNKYLQDFTERLENEECPEIGIWIDCENDSNYHATMVHLCSDDCAVIDGVLYGIITKLKGE